MTIELGKIPFFMEKFLPMKTTLGRALMTEVQADWYGSFDFGDKESVAIFERYVGRRMTDNVYEPLAAARRMMRDMESMGSPADDPVLNGCGPSRGPRRRGPTREVAVASSLSAATFS